MRYYNEDMIQVVDELAWREQRRSTAKSEGGPEFLKFFDEGMERVEKKVSSREFHLGYCFNEGFREAEAELGYVDVPYLGKMLLFAVTYWIHGEELYQNLSYLEKKLIEFTMKEGIIKRRAHLAEQATSESAL